MTFGGWIDADNPRFPDEDPEAFAAVQERERQKTCGHSTIGGNGNVFVCGEKPLHKGWHEQQDELRGPDGSTYIQRTNWGDDGLGIHVSSDEKRR